MALDVGWPVRAVCISSAWRMDQVMLLNTKTNTQLQLGRAAHLILQQFTQGKAAPRAHLLDQSSCCPGLAGPCSAAADLAGPHKL